MQEQRVLMYDVACDDRAERRAPPVVIVADVELEVDLVEVVVGAVVVVARLIF